MKPEDKTQFAEIMTGLSEVFSGKLTKAGLDLWWAIFQGSPIEEFRAACVFHVEHGKWFPKPAEIREAMAGGSVDDRAELAYAAAKRLVFDVGAYESPEISDPSMALTIAEMGGWVQFCRPGEDEAWHRKRFLKVYAANARQEGLRTPPRLAGLHETGNRTIGAGSDFETLSVDSVASEAGLNNSNNEPRRDE